MNLKRKLSPVEVIVGLVLSFLLILLVYLTWTTPYYSEGYLLDKQCRVEKGSGYQYNHQSGECEFVLPPPIPGT